MALNNLIIGHKYSKKDLSEILDNENISKVREGIYNLSLTESLFFVDLEKQDKEDRFHFDDYFEGDYFHWDSQTTQHLNTPKIQEIVKGIRTPHLFIRITPKIKSQTQPFIYCGRLNYIDYVEGTSKPVHLIFHNIDYQAETQNDDLIRVYKWRPSEIGGESRFNFTQSSGTKNHLSARLKKPSRTERSGNVVQRVGQEYHRQEMIKRWEGKCPVTGCSILAILKSSHIVPWSESNNEERLDVNNGILLSPDVDALFDRHLISFEDDGSIILSSKVTEKDLLALGIDTSVKITIKEGMKSYLKRHRERL